MLRSSDFGGRPSPVKNPKRLTPGLEKNLAAYVATAGAAGIGLLGAAQRAEARIIYTPTNTTITQGLTPIDLNNDGIVDFNLSKSSLEHSYALSVRPAVIGQGNGIRLNGNYPAAGFFGVPVGPGEPFQDGYGFMADQGGYHSSVWFTGPWANAVNKYLGFKFKINGQTHYGWARLTVQGLYGGQPLMTGYAYETVPNKSIKDGAVGPEHAESATTHAALLERESSGARAPRLGMLARGADAVAIWRREDEMLS